MNILCQFSNEEGLWLEEQIVQMMEYLHNMESIFSNRTSSDGDIKR